MSEQNKALVRRVIEEAVSRGNYQVVDELVAGDFLGHSSSPGTETHGREAYKQFISMLRSAFPDLQITIEDQIAEGDKVVTRWTASGTHEGEYAGVPPTGRRGVMTGTQVDRIAGGKLTECWANSDDLGMLQQIGAIPAPAQTA